MTDMPLVIGMSLGFVTNSSSMVHHFPNALLEDPKVAAFLRAFDVAQGYVGDDLWHRGLCETIAITPAQKEDVNRQLTENEYGASIRVSTDTDEFIVIYGDEYSSMASTLCDLLRTVCDERKIPYGGSEYN